MAAVPFEIGQVSHTEASFPHRKKKRKHTVRRLLYEARAKATTSRGGIAVSRCDVSPHPACREFRDVVTMLMWCCCLVPHTVTSSPAPPNVILLCSALVVAFLALFFFVLCVFLWLMVWFCDVCAPTLLGRGSHPSCNGKTLGGSFCFFTRVAVVSRTVRRASPSYFVSKNWQMEKCSDCSWSGNL